MECLLIAEPCFRCDLHVSLLQCSSFFSLEFFFQEVADGLGTLFNIFYQSLGRFSVYQCFQNFKQSQCPTNRKMGMHTAVFATVNCRWSSGHQVLPPEPSHWSPIVFFFNIVLWLSKFINVTKYHSSGAFLSDNFLTFFLSIFETNSFNPDCWIVFLTPLSCLDVFIKKKKVYDKNIKFSSQFYLLAYSMTIPPYHIDSVMCPRELPVLMPQHWDYKFMRSMPPYLAVL